MYRVKLKAENENQKDHYGPREIKGENNLFLELLQLLQAF